MALDDIKWEKQEYNSTKRVDGVLKFSNDLAFTRYVCNLPGDKMISVLKPVKGGSYEITVIHKNKMPPIAHVNWDPEKNKTDVSWIENLPWVKKGRKSLERNVLDYTKHLLKLGEKYTEERPTITNMLRNLQISYQL